MLAETGSEKDLLRKDMIFEIKFDGTRAICYKKGRKIKFLNRRKAWIEYRYPELQEIWKNIKKDCVLDGEIVVFNKKGLPDFNILQEREHIEDEIRIKLLSKIYPAKYIVFDVLEVEGKDIRNLPLLERKRILEKLVEDREYIKKSIYTENGKELWKFVKERDLEGVMAKVKNSPYLGKRSSYWLKIKTFKSIDCVVGGFTEGKGKRSETLGALLVGVWKGKELHYLGRVGTGFDDNKLKALKNMLTRIETSTCPFSDFDEPLSIRRISHFVKPEIVVEVKYLEFTKDTKLRAPVFLKIRSDKKPEECVISERL
jgi:bifunctional non-homologous end joining protein LigD